MHAEQALVATGVAIGAVRISLRDAALSHVGPFLDEVGRAAAPLTHLGSAPGGPVRAGWLRIVSRRRPDSFLPGRPDIHIDYGVCWASLGVEGRLLFATGDGRQIRSERLRDCDPPALTAAHGCCFALYTSRHSLEPELASAHLHLSFDSASDANIWLAACAAMQVRPRSRFTYDLGEAYL